MTTTPVRYPAAAIALHWAIAGLVLANLLLGLVMEDQTGMEKYRSFQLHKSLGITVLCLTLVRIAVRLAVKAPPYPTGTPAWQQRLAQVVHVGFYILLLAIPISGWLVASVSTLNIPTVLYGVVPWPDFPGTDGLGAVAAKSVGDTSATVHVALTYAAWVLIALHVAGALKHQFFGRDPVLYRMIPISILQKDRPS